MFKFYVCFTWRFQREQYNVEQRKILKTQKCTLLDTIYQSNAWNVCIYTENNIKKCMIVLAIVIRNLRNTFSVVAYIEKMPETERFAMRRRAPLLSCNPFGRLYTYNKYIYT